MEFLMKQTGPLSHAISASKTIPRERKRIPMILLEMLVFLLDV
jgi:hypothetical protein